MILQLENLLSKLKDTVGKVLAIDAFSLVDQMASAGGFLKILIQR